MLHSFIDFMLNLTSTWGYFGVFFLMFVESSFVPFPSEIIVPPAAYLAYKGEMSLSLVVLFALLGSLMGAYLNYFLASFLGRPFVYRFLNGKWSKYFLLNASKMEKAESIFKKYGAVSTFFGRLIPAVRQLISIPAGFVKMNFLKFTFFTSLGAFLWIFLLAMIGYFFGANQDYVELLMSKFSFYILIAFVLILLFLAYRILKKKL